MRRICLLLAASGLVLSAGAAYREPSAAAATTPQFTLSWSHTTTAKISQSSPVAATVGGLASVVVGDSGGKLDAFDLASGRGGVWVNTGAGRGILAPVSTNGQLVFAGLSTTTASAVLSAYRASDGARVWSANRCGSTLGCQQLSGMTVWGQSVRTGGAINHSIYGLAPTTGQQQWRYATSDSTNSTPAVANVYGTGSPMTIFTNDQTPNGNVNPPAVSGGHLRIFNSAGAQVCNANIGGGPTVPGSFDSSPAVGRFGGVPLIVFGTGASGSHPKQLMVFNAACQAVWISPVLAGMTIGAPAIADVLGTGAPLVVEAVADAAKHPVVYEYDPSTNRVVRSTTLSACSNFTPGTSSSVVTADLTGTGHQDLVVPAGECGAYVLDGRTLQTITVLAPSTGLQNSPLITAEGVGKVGITLAGYRAKVGGGSEGYVAHYVAAGNARLGTLGWPEFHHDPGLTGTTPQPFPVHDVLVGGQSLGAGQALVSAKNGYTTTMQTDGNVVVYQGTRLIWQSRTHSAGARLVLGTTRLAVVSAQNVVLRVLWTNGANTRPTHLVMQTDGHLSLLMAGTTPWSADTVLLRV